ncbi:GAF domain-containing protein [Candidatus Pyrohabitans sp.]
MEVSRNLKKLSSKADKNKLLEDVFNAMSEGVIVIDLDHTIVEANPAALQLFGRKKEELVGSKCYEISHGKSEPCRDVPCTIKEVLEKGEVRGLTHEHIKGSGEVWISELSATPLRDESGDIIGVVEINRDITLQKRTEKEIEHLNNVLRAINEIGRVMAREENASTIFKKVCETLHRVRGYKMVWIGLLKEDSKEVVPVAKAGVEEGYLEKVRITYDDSETGRGPTGMAIKTRKPQIMRDIPRDPRYKPWREEAMKRGYISSAAVPLVYGERVYGALNVYSDSSEVFTSEEIELLMRVGEELAFALKAIEDKDRKKEAERAAKVRSAQHAVVARIGELFLGGADIKALMQEAVELVARALEAEFCKILWLEGDRLRLVAGVGWPEGLVGKATVSAGRESQAGYTLHIRKPVIVEDLGSEKRFKAPVLLREHGIVSGMSVPMIYRDKIYGVMGVHSRRRRRFTSVDVDFLQSVANIITAAVERRRTEMALEESRKKLQGFFREMKSILQTVPAAVLTTSSDGEVNFFNRRAMEYLEKSEKEIMGTKIWEHFREAQVEAKVGELLRSKAGREPVTLETTLPSGRTVQLSLSAMRGNSGEVEGLVISFVDITQLKEAREKLERAYEELKEIDELKSNIIANVSHELRTPITIAKGFIELAAIEDDDEERRNELMSAIAALHRLNDIVEDLLQVATISRGDLGMHKKRVSLVEIVNSAVKEKEGEARKKNVRMEVDFAYDGDIVADAIKLKRVILNLLDNAIKFNRTGGETRVRVSREGEWVKIAVSDTGIGIPEDRLDEIFKPLTQLDPSPTRRYGGTGTGLAVAKRIIETHGGKIWVESEVGKGTTVYFMLPVGG